MPRIRLNHPWTAERLEEPKVMLLKDKSLATMVVHYKRSQDILNKLRELNLPTPRQLKQRAAEFQCKDEAE